MFGSRHNISELSSAFSTGNSGATFEHNIQAVFLLTLLVDGFSPILEAPIDRIELQAKHLGYAIDDSGGSKWSEVALPGQTYAGNFIRRQAV